jgi:hypothetical protein
MELSNGTYLRLGRHAKRVEIEHGYWVGTKEVELESINNGTLFGVWEDDAGKIWLDLVEYVETLDKALELGYHYNQLAIYDNYNKEAINL